MINIVKYKKTLCNVGADAGADTSAVVVDVFKSINDAWPWLANTCERVQQFECLPAYKYSVPDKKTICYLLSDFESAELHLDFDSVDLDQLTYVLNAHIDLVRRFTRNESGEYIEQLSARNMGFSHLDFGALICSQYGLLT